jgi:hypothetical protein
MKKNELDKDQGLRLAVQHKNEAAERMTLSEDFTDRLMQRIEQQDEQPSDNEQQPKHRRVWLYSAIGAVAASIALLMVIHLAQNTTGEQPSLMAQTDTTQTVIKKVEEQPLQKETNTEAVDSVKMIKEKYRAPRIPRNYMAKAETVENTPEPDVIDEVELAERAFAEEKRRIEMELMAQMSGSMQADFMEMTNEIRSRGERMAQHVEMAMSNEE